MSNWIVNLPTKKTKFKIVEKIFNNNTSIFLVKYKKFLFWPTLQTITDGTWPIYYNIEFVSKNDAMEAIVTCKKNIEKTFRCKLKNKYIYFIE